jgi:hydrogenase expression/formation protein HypD
VGMGELRHVDEYRRQSGAAQLRSRLADICDPARTYRVMEICGGHTHTIYRHGLSDHLPDNVRFVHGPGCPVCVLPKGRIDDAMALALDEDVTLCAYGDVLRVPGSEGSMLDARARGADIRMVYSPLDALRLAREHPELEVVFFAIGFETTAPATAATVLDAQRDAISNFSVICNHVLVVPPMQALLDSPDVAIDGLIGPGHVSAIIGCTPYLPLVEQFGLPLVVAGFEPLDLLAALVMVVEQLNDNRHEVENQYSRVVPWEPNPVARSLFDDAFALRETFEWRGLGPIPRSGFRIADRLADFDAERRYGVIGRVVPDPRACRCGDVLRGAIEPTDCRIFGTACTPEHPVGSCMVSSEGACAAYFQFGRGLTGQL